MDTISLSQVAAVPEQTAEAHTKQMDFLYQAATILAILVLLINF